METLSEDLSSVGVIHSACVTVWGTVNSETGTVPPTGACPQQTKDSFPAGFYRCRGQVKDCRGRAEQSCLPYKCHHCSEEGSETGATSREALLDEEVLSRQEKMGHIWKGMTEGNLEKTHMIPA